jgi:L-asparagine oxygenase
VRPVTALRQEYVLDDAERRVMAALAEQTAPHLSDGPAENAGELMSVPEGLRRALRSFADGTRAGFLHIRGLDIGELPDTPSEAGHLALTDHVTTGTLLLVAELLGGLVGYADEKSGDLLHEVHPVRGEETRIENSGSVAFDFHTENVQHPLRPDFLGLLCLRQDHEFSAATRVASIREAVDGLDGRDVEVLREPRFRSLYPTSFTRGATGERPRSGPHPVLFGHRPRLFMRFNSHNTQADDAAGRRALGALAERLEFVCHDLVLQPGELVIVDNHVAAHGRSAFVPRYDGRDRWLRRFYSLGSVPRWAEEMMPRPRVLPSMAEIQGVL